MTSIRKAIVFISVSSQEQAKKVSLADQERDGYAAAKRLGAEVIKVLAVRGFSRSESDIELFLQEMAEIQEYAFHELRDLWRANHRNRAKNLPLAFDLLIVREHSRLGRSNSLHAWVIENVLRSGAEVYLYNKDRLMSDVKSSRIDIAFGGYESTSEIDNNVLRMQKGIDDVVKKGLPGTRPPFPFRIVRDSLGKRVRVEIDETQRPILDRLYELLMSGVAYAEWEVRLAQEGFINPSSGKRYHPNYFYFCLHNPHWWGNSSRFHYGRPLGEWIWRPTETPDGVVIHYNTHEPVWTGKQAEAAQAEIRRRSESVTGRANPATPKLFTGLIVCDECGTSCIHRQPRGLHYWVCVCHIRRYASGRNCSQRRHTKQEKIIKYISDLFAYLVSIDSVERAWRELQSDATTPIIDLDAIQARIVQTNAEIRNLISLQISAPENTRAVYSSMIEEKSKLLETYQQQLLKATHDQSMQTQVLQEFSRGFEAIKTIGIQEFWSLPALEINQTLHAVFGKTRLRLRDGEVVGLLVS